MDFVGDLEVLGAGDLEFDSAFFHRDRHHDAPAGHRRKKPEKAVLGYFDGDPTKIATNPLALVVHYGFNGFCNMKRDGDLMDVQNLREALETGRGCAFRELASPTKQQLLALLGSHEICNNGLNPSVFILIILSHGDKDGKIMTEHLLDPESAKNEKIYKNQDFVSFTTIEVLDALKNNNSLKDSLKLIFFGPCRGESIEKSISPELVISSEGENCNSCRVYNQPNVPNFILFFSTIESTVSNRDSKLGTWMVQCLRSELESVTDDDVELEVLLTRMLNAIHNHPCLKGIGQTPEVKIFPHRRFTFLREPRDETIEPAPSCCDGSGDVKNVENDGTRQVFYSWRDKNETPLSRGQALIFYSVCHDQVENMESTLNQLSFVTTKMPIGCMEGVTTNVNQGVCDSGCILVCVFAKISVVQNDIFEELVVDLGGESPKPIQNVISLFVGPRCNKWIGKPKIFFFMDPCKQLDTGMCTQAQTIGFDFSSIGTKHSGLFVFVSSGMDSIEKLVTQLQQPEMKSGLSLQEAVGLVVRSSTHPPEMLPQVFTTLQFLVDFPDLENTFVPPSMQQVAIAESANLNPDGDSPELIKQFSFSDFRQSIIEFDFEPMDTSESYFDAGHSSPAKRPRLRTKSRRLGNKAWVLHGPPGVGKTLMTRQMSKWVRSNLPEYLEFDVHFLQKADYFSETEWDSISVEAFLLPEEPSPEQRSNLKQHLAQRRVVVFLDGFEKICPKYRQPASILLRQLNELGLPLWVTTRNEELETVRKALAGPRLHLLRINSPTRREQLHLLRVKLKKSENECQELLDHFGKFQADEFLYNPYHLSLVADVYKKNGAMPGLFNCLEYVVDFKVRDVLVHKEGLDPFKRSFSGNFRELKGLLVRGGVTYYAGGTFLDGYSKDEICRFNSVGVATVDGATGRVELVHELFAGYLATLEFLNRVRKARPMGDEGRVLIAPRRYLLEPPFGVVRRFLDSFVQGEREALEKFLSRNFIVLSDLHLSDVADAFLQVVRAEGLFHLLEFVFECAQDPEADERVKESVWMDRDSALARVEKNDFEWEN